MNNERVRINISEKGIALEEDKINYRNIDLRKQWVDMENGIDEKLKIKFD